MAAAAAGHGPLPRQQGGLGRAGLAAVRVKRGVGTAGITVEEEKCKMNLFPIYDKIYPQADFHTNYKCLYKWLLGEPEIPSLQ